MNKTKDFSPSSSSPGWAGLFVCFVRDLYEVPYDKATTVHLHPVEVKQFCSVYIYSILYIWQNIQLNSCKKKCWWHTPHAVLTFAESNHLGRQVFFNANRQHKSMLVIFSNSMYSSLGKYDFAKIPLHLANTIAKLPVSGDFPSGIEGRGSHRGKCRGEGRGWGAYHYLVFEELLQDLMLCTCGVTGLGKTLYRYHACCDAGPAAAVFTVQGSSQQCRSSGKALSLYIPLTHLTRKIFPPSESMSILSITESPPLPRLFSRHPAHRNLSCWSLPDVHQAKYVKEGRERQKNPSPPGWS